MGGDWNLEMWYGEGGSVEEKQSYLSRKPFLLLKLYDALIELNMFKVRATKMTCVDSALSLR